LEDLGVNGRIILKWIFKKWDVVARTGLICLWIEIAVGACECGNDPSGSTKRGKFMRKSYLLTMDSAPWNSLVG
jgi:hypothetical protein